jgi:hypothetical protein
MRLILFVLFILLPCFSFAQGQVKEKKFKIKIGTKELLTDSIPDVVDALPQRLNKFSIKRDKEKEKKDKDKGKNKGVARGKDQNQDKDKAKEEPPLTYTVQIGEEEHEFITDGEYHEIKFSKDIKELVIYILDEKRAIAGKPFILKKRK